MYTFVANYNVSLYGGVQWVWQCTEHSTSQYRQQAWASQTLTHG